ncbi:RNA-directed DNA polymerase, eukaryota, reverse transcriptase zinc-binding domain protein [Tanacetum coccineum]
MGYLHRINDAIKVTLFDVINVQHSQLLSTILELKWEMSCRELSLGMRFIKAIYGDKGALDNVVVPHHRSPWLDNIRVLLSLKKKGIDLMAFIKKKVGNGEDSKFWNDIWLGDLALKAQYPRVYAMELHKDISVAEKKRDSSLALSFLRPPRGGAKEEQYFHLLSRVDEVSLACMLDRWVWTFDSSEEFLVKSVRILIHDMFLPKEVVHMRWVNVVPLKVNILAWSVWLDKLPTRFNLSLRGVVISSILCPLCSVSVKSTSHLFFSCSLARQVRSEVLCW